MYINVYTYTFLVIDPASPLEIAALSLIHRIDWSHCIQTSRDGKGGHSEPPL